MRGSCLFVAGIALLFNSTLGAGIWLIAAAFY